MNTSPQSIAYVLERIASPLMNAVLQSEQNKDPSAIAQTMADLLTQTTQAADQLNTDLKISRDHATRLALNGALSAFIGDHYKKQKNVPNEEQRAVLNAALEPALKWITENPPDPSQGDKKTQDTINTIKAFLPIIQAIALTPAEKKQDDLLVNTIKKIKERSDLINKKLFNGEGDDIALLSTLCTLYEGVHTSMVNREDGKSDPETIWALFETCLSMLSVFAGHLSSDSPNETGDDNKAPAPENTAQDNEKPVSGNEGGFNPMQTFSNKPDTDTPSPPASESATSSDAPKEKTDDTSSENQAFNPMSGFSQKPADETQNQDNGGTDNTDKAPPPAPPSQDNTPDTQNTKNSEGGGPMSFFKKPPKKEDD